ncbi:MAG: D-glycero-alpha-D-manno-heptose-1,7-bisphosphate 7-phosphatase, partial [Dehalococcoidia bacterium]
ITNQSGIGRGYFDRARLDLIHQRLEQLLEVQGVHLDGIYYCPHTLQDNCACRKPGTDLLESAARKLGFNPLDCFVVGDKPCDIEMGQQVGARTFLVQTGYGAEVAEAGTATPDHIVANLQEAAEIIQQTFSAQAWKSVNEARH